MPYGEDIQEGRPLAPRAPVRPDSPLFSDLGVAEDLVKALADVGIKHAFAIQELTLPIALKGQDLIGQARTGTGKTLGFGVPLLQRITSPEQGASGRPQALVVVPTRELCTQVTKDLETAGRLRKIRCLSIYGGRAYEPQIKALKAGVDVVIGTPGRLLDLAQQRLLDLSAVQILVLDEADEMLDLGFLPDIERVIEMLPTDRQTMLFSATMPGPIVSLARRFMRQPTHVRAEAHGEGSVVPTTAQFAYRTHPMDTDELLARVLQARNRGRTMVFCRTKRAAARISDHLTERGFAAVEVHGNLGQNTRERALRAFRTGKADVLVATDVAARGIDVEAVTHVINYQCPEDEKVYLHRIGRTGRAGAAGTAVTFVDWEDLDRWKQICDALDLPFHEPAETYSTSEHLFVDLDIPEDAGAEIDRPAEKKSRRQRKSPRPESSRTRQRRRTRAGTSVPNGQSDQDSPDATATATTGVPTVKRQRKRTRAGQEASRSAGANSRKSSDNQAQS